jgi:SAM-dependent methyltransferase
VSSRRGRSAGPRLTALTADRYELYHRSVQSPDAEVAFVERVYRQAFGRRPLVLREDFCGTGLVACEWARHRPACRALGVDLDPGPLAWGETHVRSALPAAARARVRLVQGDVRHVRGTRADVVQALNFSYMVFHERAVLRDYFRAARRHLAGQGLFVIDVFGGWEAQAVAEEVTEHRGFDYVWDQDAFDPLSHRMRCYIHFRFPDRTRLWRAFSYDWRLWTVPELREVLAEAGFGRVDAYLESVGADGWGTGTFRRATRAEPCEGFVAYLVARKG